MRLVSWGSVYDAVFCIACMATIPLAVAVGSLKIGIGRNAALLIVICLGAVMAVAILRIAFGLLQLMHKSVLSVAVEISSWSVRFVARALLMLLLASLVLQQPQWIAEAGFYLGCISVLIWSLWIVVWSRDWILHSNAGVGRRKGVLSRRQWDTNTTKHTFEDIADDTDDVVALLAVTRSE